jgi:ABC-2 type transport system ATP-binding protein
VTVLDDLTAPTPSPEPAISVRALTKHFGSIAAVDSLDLDVPTGSVFGLIGPNGAGKSTTFAILATLLKPTSGTVRVAGHDPVAAPFEVRRRLGYMPDVMGVYDNLRVDEYLEFFAAAYHVPRATWPDLVAGLLELVDLGGKQDASVDSLSRGMKQRLSLARALVHDPEVLILDEPASGLDPRARVELRNLVHGLRDMGKTVVISSHILAELEEMCTDIAILEAGRLVASGTPRDIVASIGGGRRIAVRFADGTDELFTVADDAEQVALLRRLVIDEGRHVLEFADEGNLESLFLSVTKGIVQ